MLALDSGGVSGLAVRSRQVAALIQALRELDVWPPLVPSVVLVDSLQGHTGRDAHANAFLKTCDIGEDVPEHLARRGSAVDALVVAFAEPDGTVLTGDADDLAALAQFADRVRVERI